MKIQMKTNMKLSIKEIIKRIKILEDELIVLNQEEDKDNYVIYLKDEKVEKSTYDFDKTNKKRQEINQEILRLKIIVQKANIKTITSYKGLSISELLILLAQKSALIQRFDLLCSKKQKARKTTNDGQNEYIEYLYDINKLKDTNLKLKQEIASMQVAIDKANIETLIEI